MKACRQRLLLCGSRAESHAILFSVVSVIAPVSGGPMTFPLGGRFHPGAFPPQALPCFCGTMPHLTSWPSFRCSRCYTWPPILPSGKNDQDLPRSPNHCCYRPCSPTPGRPPALCPFAMARVLSSENLTSSTLPKVTLTGLNHFSPKAYGLQHPCLRLTAGVADSRPRLGTRCAGSTLSRWHLRPLAIRRLVAH